MQIRCVDDAGRVPWGGNGRLVDLWSPGTVTAFRSSTPLSALLCVLLVPGHTVHIPGTYPTRSNDRIALWRPTVADLSPSARIARIYGEGDKVSGVRLYGSHAAAWAPGRPAHVVRW